jgi:L-fucose mutarotase/ribose pyranase (RbsD/FucU family)
VGVESQADQSEFGDDAVKPKAWEKTLDERLPLFGHRNWIVVADAAYPAQSGQGIETIVSGVSQQVAIKTVLARLRVCKHVHPVIHVDRELALVDEKDAPGIDSYRNWLKGALKGLSVTMTPHDEIISKLDHAARMFSILIVKSTMAIPYTSVFIELDCGYWNADAEARLRSRI